MVRLSQLARVAAMSPFHFLRLFRTTFGQTPHQFAMDVRLERAKRLLAETNLSITAICDAVGYVSLGSFSTLFRNRTGMSPRDYRVGRRRYWTMGVDFAPLFVPGCFFHALGVRVDSQFPRRIAGARPAILSAV
jgi:AraC-like DNA-binding protein